MHIPLSVRLMNRIIDKIALLDTDGKLKLTVGHKITSYVYEINGTSKEDGVYIFCDDHFCTVEYKDFVCTDSTYRSTQLTEGNLDEVAVWMFTKLTGV